MIFKETISLSVRASITDLYERINQVLQNFAEFQTLFLDVANTFVTICHKTF